jgi:hypothetical protein
MSAVVGGVAMALVGCGGVPAGVVRNGVRVSVQYRAVPAGDGAIVATFRPVDRRFHLYSKDLPDQGVSGIGRPTRVHAVSGATETGPAAASVSSSALYVAPLGLSVSVYPPGPVTLVVPARRTGGAVLVSYAACSETVCLPPVVNQAVQINLEAT